MSFMFENREIIWQKLLTSHLLLPVFFDLLSRDDFKINLKN